MIKRKNFISKYTYNVLDNMPSWLKLKDTESNGFPLINAFGAELERSDQQFNENFNDVFIKTSNPNQVKDLYFIDSRRLINKETLTASGKYGDVTIYVVNNEYDFLNNKANRVEYLRSVNLYSGLLSGIMSGVFGIKYFYDYSSGYYYVINDGLAVNPSSILIYDDNFNRINNTTYASGRMDYDHFGVYEIVEPEASSYLSSRYPEWRIKTSGDVVSDIIVSYSSIPHYDPPQASGWTTKWYYDDDGFLKYYLTALNNPYGSGVYNLSSGHLSYTPISGTLKVYDILNLNQSGEPTQIPATGFNMYRYISPSNDFTYIGYEDIIPQRYEGYAGLTGTLLYNTSWFQGKTSGYLDDDVPPHSGTFRYIHGTGEYTNIIWFNNANSKYMLEYDFSKFTYLQDIATDVKYNNNIDMLPTNPFLLTQSNNNYVSVPWEFAKTSLSGIRVDGDYIRPGRDAKITTTLTDVHSQLWVNPSGQPFNLNLYRLNLGYSQSIIDKSYAVKGY